MQNDHQARPHRARNVTFVVLFVVFVGIGLIALWAKLNSPSDLRFVSVEIIGFEDDPDFDPKYGHDLLLRKEFLVSFSSDEDLIKFAQRFGYSMGIADLHDCASDKNPPDQLGGGGYFYWEKLNTELAMKDDTYTKLAGQHVSGTPFIFKMYFSIKSPGNDKGIVTFAPYDLQEKPMDLCFHVAGTNESFMSFRSNEVVIPKESFEAAFKRAGMTTASERKAIAR